MAKHEANQTPVVIPQPRTETRYVDRHVTVHRAPTDESVKLLKEMEEKAEEKLIQSVSVGNTTFECVIQMWKEAMDDSTHYRAIFKLNGKQLVAEISYSGYEARINDRSHGIHKLRDEMAKVIAAEVLVDALRSARELGP